MLGRPCAQDRDDDRAFYRRNGQMCCAFCGVPQARHRRRSHLSLVGALVLAALLCGATVAQAQTGSTASSLTVATPESNKALVADQVNEPAAPGQTPFIERVAREPRRVAVPVLARATLGPANTPVRVVTATPTTGGGGTPTPTQLSWGWCQLCACPGNTASIFWSTSSTVTTATGEELMPGVCKSGLPATDYTCGIYYVVSGTASQCWTLTQEP